MRNLNLINSRSGRVFTAALMILVIFTGDVFAGGPWVLEPGQAYLTTGFSRKVGKQRYTHFHLDVNKTPKNYTDDVDSFALVTPADSTTVDGKFHDFRYYYFQGYVGICKNLELDWTINFLEGREASRSNPYTGKLYTYTDAEGNPVIGENGSYHYAVWELNSGFTDSWMGLKYQFLHKAWPMAAELSVRFPDLYLQPSEAYSRYNNQYLSYTHVDGDSSYNVKDTIIEAGPEWRGLLGRDFGFILHTGHSFPFNNYAFYFQAFAGYNLRLDQWLHRTAYADQLMLGASCGYQWKVSDKWTILPTLNLDYVGGIGNGGQPVTSDRFYSTYKNNNFNNSKHFRGYLNVEAIFDKRFDVKLGYGNWLWGRGEVKYNEMFVQLSYVIGCKEKN